MALPQTRQLTDAAGYGWLVTVDRGQLRLTRPSDGFTVLFARPEELRALAPQLTRAVTEHALDAQLTAAKASADRRQRRALAGHPTGLRHHPFVEPPEPPAHMEIPA